MMKVPLSRHEREVAHEDRLALDLTGVVVGELRRDVERSGVGEVLLLALVDGVLRVVEDRVLERQRHRLGEVLDRGDLLEDLLADRTCSETSSPSRAATLDGGLPGLVADQPVEAVGLEGEELRNLERFGDLCERDAAGVTSGGARGQEVSFDGFAHLGWRRPTTKSATGQADSHLRAGAKRSHYRRSRRATTPACARGETLRDDHEPRDAGEVKCPRRRSSRAARTAERVSWPTGEVTMSSTSQSPPTFSIVTVTWSL